MKDELFQQLAASLRESGAILCGKKKPARNTTLNWPDAKAVREKPGLSQSRFAALIGISPRTLPNWEQAHRRPEGTGDACWIAKWTRAGQPNRGKCRSPRHSLCRSLRIYGILSVDLN
jgi:putative transcriptional regulator